MAFRKNKYGYYLNVVNNDYKYKKKKRMNRQEIAFLILDIKFLKNSLLIYYIISRL